MKQASFQWQLPKKQELPETFIQTLKEKNIPLPLGSLFWNRQLQTPEAVEAFLSPSLDTLHDPFLFFEMDKAVERIQQAIMEGERILVYGDYDADGITSTTIMKETLELLGADVEFYLPNRFTDGYGPNQAVYERKIAEGIQLIVTVDNGVSGHEAINYANEQGVDVIVTDHHEMPQDLPEAYAIIHPRHPAGEYPFGELAGVGVAFKVACALLEEVPVEFLDLVAIGTIADMVSLTDENRVLVTFGLQTMKQTERIGLAKLIDVSGIQPEGLNETSIGFSIGPRLNAIGRLEDPNPAVHLMSTFDEEEAQTLAEKLDRINTRRKDLVEVITEEAMAMVRPDDRINVIAGENWHEGILGIVAGRILRATGKPTLVLTIKEDGLAKGSGRSTESVNLFEMLDSMREWMTSFGGHHAAVGLSLEAANVAILQEKLNAYMLEHDLTSGIDLAIDAILPLAAVSLEFIDSLQLLAPFGMDNPLPNFLFEKVSVTSSRTVGSDNQHLKFSLIDETNQQLDGIGFGFGSESLEFQSDELSVVGQLSINEWNGKRIPQLMLEDYQINALQVFDYRPKRNQHLLNFEEKTLFICFSEHNAKQWAKKVAQPIVTVTQLETFQEQVAGKSYQQVVFIDCPIELSWLKKVLACIDVSRVYMMCVAEDDAYLDGIGSREQYAKFFKFIASQPQVDVRYKLSMVAQYLQIPKKLLVFMIQVFTELGFVTVVDGVMRKVENPTNHPLMDSVLYQQRLQKIKTEEFLLLSDLSTLKDWLAVPLNEEN
ncbi:single-stranded-DNA-specific exonuclease RecJ [Enterococcus saccharolyticus]|uniref:single-stranded-DNA-specific exonuclease RecJ n=2 Tax=Enterococcus TaxID=1350 RepID=UPI001E2A79DD|nr:single-stranded-DNA-specific exonuclease RecJ [Enterococcus saccharolyticus]MCD5000909.1 single-stranded-DNA-specific exonuclease RecJ [Enterococcus saccharolyticus]